MNEILDAILVVRQPPPPTSPLCPSPSPTARSPCTRTRRRCSTGSPPGRRTPASPCTSTRCRCPNSARARRWWPSWPARSTTTPCGPRSSSRVSTFALPGALRAPVAAHQAARPAVPRHRLRPRGRRAAHRPRRQRLEARRRGRRALPLRRAGVLRRPQRHDARPRAAHLGLRDQLRRPRRDRAGQVQPADAQAGPPELGGGRRARPGQLHRLPAAGLPQRRRHEAGRQRADLGRERRTRLVRHPVRAGRRRQPDLRGLQRAEGGDLPARWAPRRSSTATPRATSSGRTSTTRTRRSGSASASASAS